MTQELITALRDAFLHSTRGQWQKGRTTHETTTETGYKIGEFHHADDASFCDLAHEHMPRLLDALERLTANNKELIDNGDRLLAVADSLRDEKTRLTAENAELKEGLDGWHSRFLDCEVERDAAFAMSHCQCGTDEACANLARLTAERDAYQIAADKMAMEHKIERDALSVQVDALAKDAAALVQRGRDAMREEAVKVCDESAYPDGWDLARLIGEIK